MPSFSPKKSNFTSGELSPTLADRSDIKQYSSGVSKMRNCVVIPHGGFRRRPGLAYQATAKSLPFVEVTVPAGGLSPDNYIYYNFDIGAHLYTNISVFRKNVEDIARQRLIPYGSGTPGRNSTRVLLGPSLDGSDLSIQYVNLGYSPLEGDVFTIVGQKMSGASAEGATPITASDAIHMESFSFSNQQTYLMVFTAYSLSIYRKVSGAYTLMDVLGMPYPNSQLSEITITQQLDSLLIFHPECETLWVKRGTTHTSWTLEAWPYAHLPQYAFEDSLSPASGVDHVQLVKFMNSATRDWVTGYRYSILVDSDETEAIAFSTVTADNEANLRAGLIALEGIDADSVTVSHSSAYGDAVSDDTFVGGFDYYGTTYVVTFSNENGSKEFDFEIGIDDFNVDGPRMTLLTETKGKRNVEDAFSHLRGYPRCGTFFQGRLWVAGSYSLPQSVWSSRSGNFFDFNSDLALADNGIDYTANTDQVSTFHNIVSGRHLILLSSSAEFYIPVSDKEAVTPENFILRRTSQRGSKEGLKAFAMPTGTTFVQYNGKALNQIGYKEASGGYDSLSLSKLSFHLIDNPVSASFVNSTSSEESDYLYLVNTDGTLAVLTTLQEEGVNAWSLFSTDGSFKSTAVVYTDSLFAVSRNISDGSPDTRVFIEMFEEGLHMDSGISGTGVVSGTSALSHLPSREVSINLDNSVQPNKTLDTSSSPADITFARDSVTSWEAGLPFPDVSSDGSGYQTLVQMFPIEAEPGGQSIRGEKVSVQNVSLALYESSHVSVSVGGGTLYRFPFQNYNGPLLNSGLPVFSGHKEIEGLQNYTEDGIISIVQTQSLGLTVLGITLKASY